MDFLFILTIFFIYLVLDYLIAKKFESIANLKGHSGYFVWCFIFGIIGYLMVIALPYNSNDIPQANDELPPL